MPTRNHIEARGIVQGIGFRPLVWGLAAELNLTGYVLNNSKGVEIEVQGSKGDLDRFVLRLQSELPPGGVLREIIAEEVEPKEIDNGFSIVQSRTADITLASLAPV